MVSIVRVNPDNDRDFHPVADHMKGEIYEFSAIPFSLELMFDQTLTNLIVCMMSS